MIEKKDVLFPFDDMREGQESFMKVVRTALEHKKCVLAHMPTGLGKTVAALGPSLKFALENNKTVLFLTSKHTHHRIAIETLKRIKEKYGLNFSAVDFIGKKWMCARGDVDFLNANDFREYCKSLTNKKECDFYENYVSPRNKGTVKRSLNEISSYLMHVEEVQRYCQSEGICPFEAAIDAAKNSKVIVADYFHVLNPATREVFFKRINKELENCIIVWDEAHNLPDRARDLMSVNLNTYILEQATKEADLYNQDLNGPLGEMGSLLLKLSDKLGLKENESLVKKDEFVLNDWDQLIGDLRKTAEPVVLEKKRSFLGSVANFLEAWEIEQEGYTRIISRTFGKTGKPILTLSHRCLDPSLITKEVIEGAHSNIFMSGTLYHLDMYEDILGLKLPLKVEYPNPFPQDNRLDLIVPKTTTKYDRRTKGMYNQIAQTCRDLIEYVNGNMVLFFPSYDIRDEVYGVLSDITDKRIFLEKSEMNKEEKVSLIRDMIRLSEEGVVLMGVSGGSFGEGINLKGEALKCVVVVGIPFARNDLETKELIKYYDSKFGKGMDYGYVVPAFVKVLQNAGRCIRSEKDVGAIVYLDERYAWSNYKKYFPLTMQFYVSDDLETVKRFFGKRLTR